MTPASDRARLATELRARALALCPALAALGPSPLERWQVGGQSVWVKRDDLLGEGGTKLRKLMAELPDAGARGQRVLTFGYLDSNHALATVRFGASINVPVELRLLGKEAQDPARLTLLRLLAPTALHAGVLGLGMGTLWRLLVARLKGERLLRFPPGGTTARSTAAVAAAVVEVLEQLEERGEPLPERWVVAVGSGGTLAGLLAGVKALGLPVRIHGVAASSRWVGRRRVRRLANRALRLLGILARVQASEVEIGWEQFGGGHAQPTAESAEVVRELSAAGHGVEPVFTAKALAWMKKEARPGERWLFWHTGVAVR